MTRLGRGMCEQQVFALLKAGTRIAHIPESVLRDGGNPDYRQFVVGDRIFPEDEEAYTESDPWNGLLSLEDLGLVEQIEEKDGTILWKIKEGADETKVPRT